MNADKVSVDVITYPDNPEFDENIRQFQGCPTIAATKNGRIFAGWYSGGNTEPDIKNYNILVYSDDRGKTWTKPVLIIPSDRKKLIHALDIQLWITPSGKLRVFWTQNDVQVVQSTDKIYFDLGWRVVHDGILFEDFAHACWCVDCEDPDAETLVFSEPKFLGRGFLRCKPTCLNNGQILYCNYDQLTDDYMYSLSDGEDAPLQRRHGAKKIRTPFDESMVYQLKNGDIRFLARSSEKYLASSISKDNGKTWGEAVLSDIPNPDTRFYIGRTPKGSLLLVYNDDTATRTNMTAALSYDDGKTWSVKKTFDCRNELSYPDVDFFEDDIYLVYDRERRGAKEILFTTFTESQLQCDDFKPEIRIISKP